jgi:hypothetical protein
MAIAAILRAYLYLRDLRVTLILTVRITRNRGDRK